MSDNLRWFVVGLVCVAAATLTTVYLIACLPVYPWWLCLK